MEYRTLGRTGMRVSALGFGGAEIPALHGDPAGAHRLLEEALDAGLTVIDTGECYDSSEELIGGVAHRRAGYLLFTKCGHADGLPGADWEVPMLERSVDRSLRRLRTDHLDLLQLHGCSEAVLRKGDVIAWLQRVKAAGKTRFIGYSGDGANASYAVECGAFDTLQTSVNIADQQAIDLTLPAAQDRGMGVIAKRPVANAAWRTGRRPADRYHHVYWDRLQALDYAFLKGDLAEAVGCALRFTLAVPGVGTAIVGTARHGRWAENAALLAAGPLPAAEHEAIRARWRAVAKADWVGQG